MNNQRSSSSSSTFNSYNFDFGIPNRSSSNRPLKDHKNNPNPSYTTTPPSSSSRPSPNKPAWTHQPTPSAPRSGASNPPSMVGDIFGKTWSSSSIGIPKSDPNLFGDLIGTALGQGKSASNVPLKAAPPQNAYSMGNLADSLPKGPAWPTSRGSAENLGSYGAGSGNPVGGGVTMGASMGGSSMKSEAAVGTGQRKDPFSSLMDFGAKPSAGSSGSVKSGGKGGGGDFSFGEFQSSRAKGSAMNSNNKGSAVGGGSDDYSFGDFHNSDGMKGTGSGGGGDGGGDFSFGVFEGSSAVKNDSFGVPPPPQASQTTGTGVDPLDSLFSSPAVASSDVGGGSQSFMEANDWDLGGEFGGGDGGGSTTELDGLPPPPAGITTMAAVSKGSDNHKQGQFADAIKWLSWAVVLMERSGNNGRMAEVLTCRASCYKEVGEYKKAIADCSKVLNDDSKNVAVLVQRALLYESTEKYKLGAADLRAVLKIDPTNRLAKTTIHRLTQLSG